MKTRERQALSHRPRRPLLARLLGAGLAASPFLAGLAKLVSGWTPTAMKANNAAVKAAVFMTILLGIFRETPGSITVIANADNGALRWGYAAGRSRCSAIARSDARLDASWSSRGT